MEKELRNLIRKILSESQLDDVSVPNYYFSLGNYISNESKNINENDKKFIINEVNGIIHNGKGNLTYENTIKTSRELIFNLIISIVASLYKGVGSNEKSNIRSFVFIAFNPYIGTQSHPSKFSNTVIKQSGAKHNELEGEEKTKFFIDIISDSIFESIDYSLNAYKPDSASFVFLLTLKSSSKIRDMLKSQKAKKNSKIYADRSIEDIGDVQDSDFEYDDFNLMKLNFIKVIDGFIKMKLEQSKYSINHLWFYQRFVLENKSLNEMAEELQNRDIDKEDKPKDYPRKVRVIKIRFEYYIDKFVKDGTFQNYILKHTGIPAKFPNNEFKLKMNKEEEIESEPLLIWKYDDNNPDKGEWVEINLKDKNSYVKDKIYEIKKIINKILSENQEMVDEERIANSDAIESSRNKKNFIGTNLYGESLMGGYYDSQERWIITDQIYLIFSYDFPIYINYGGKWYYNIDDYIFDGKKITTTDEHKEQTKPSEKMIPKTKKEIFGIINRFRKKYNIKSFSHNLLKPGELS